jgi:hypothetical protein
MLRSFLEQIKAWWQRKDSSTAKAPAANPIGERIERIILTDGVARTLFDDYASHRLSERGTEEIGWDLLGYRNGDEVIAMAALPAGMERDAGVAHVLFNRDVQELLSHILRQKDKRLGVIGVVHTHPGGMRHPSDGDFQGDRLWVGQLRGGEAVFGIGTADARTDEAPGLHQQCFGNLCLTWYALAQGDSQYRRLPVQVALGVDLARPLLAIWEVLETHAKPLNRLYRQLARVACSIGEMDGAPGLAVAITLADRRQQLRLLLNATEARYYWDRDGEVAAIDPNETPLDRAVFLILAELAKERSLPLRSTPALVGS